MGLIGALSNHDYLSKLTRLSKSLSSLQGTVRPDRRLVAQSRKPRLRTADVLVSVLETVGGPLQLAELYAMVDQLVEEPVRRGTIKQALSANLRDRSRSKARFERVGRGRYRLAR